MTTLDYEQLANALETAGLEISAAEAHGILTGAVCASSTLSLRHLFFSRTQPAAGAGADRLLDLLAEAQTDAQRRLAGEDFDFEPLLDTSAHLSVSSLGDWARGFVFGLTTSVPNAATLPGEAGEFVRDALRIGEVEAPSGDTEQQARDVAEIVEYLRVGVQLVYEELRALR